MKLKYILIYNLISICLLSCSKSEKSEAEAEMERINVDLDNVEKKYNLNDLEYESIHLEFSDESLIGTIDKLIFLKDKLFVLDAALTKSVFCFTNLGKYLYKIGAIGEGEGEYLRPFDFHFFEDTNELHIIDVSLAKTLVFDIEGNFLREFKFPFSEQIMTFFPLNQHLTVYHIDGRSVGSGETEFLKIFDNRINEFVSSGVSDVGNTDAYKNLNEFSVYKNKVRFLHSWTDTIFSVQEDGIFPEYILDFGPHRLKKDIKKLPLNDMRTFFMTNPYVFNTSSLFENDEFISFRWVRSKEGFQASGDDTFVSYYNKKTKKLVQYPLHNNWLKNTSMVGPLAVGNDSFIGFMEYEEWLTLDDKASSRSRPGSQGNPVLIKYKL